MYVPSLKKKLVFVVVLEDRGYDVVFNKGKAYLKHVSTRKVKQIGVRVKNIYKLEVYFAMHTTIPLAVKLGDVEP